MRHRGRAVALCVALLAAAAGMQGAEAAQTWRGLAVAPEHRCTLHRATVIPTTEPRLMHTARPSRARGRWSGPSGLTWSPRTSSPIPRFTDFGHAILPFHDPS